MGGHHHHTHGHHGHGHHDHTHGASRRRIGIAALLTGLFMVAEVVGGVISGSLALLADAGHMLTDFAALAMAWGAFVLMARPATPRLPYGWDRVSILVAFVNGLSLFAVAALIVWEAFHRFREPGEVLAGPMLAVAVAGLVVNIVVFWIMMGADRDNLNVRGAVLHVIGDMLGSVAAIAAALIILRTGWVVADPVLSVLVALLILRSAWMLVRQSAHVLMQGAPTGLEEDQVRAELLANVGGLASVARVQSWSVTPERPVMAVSVKADDGVAHDTLRDAVKAHLRQRFGVKTVTVEVSADD